MGFHNPEDEPIIYSDMYYCVWVNTYQYADDFICMYWWAKERCCIQGFDLFYWMQYGQCVNSWTACGTYYWMCQAAYYITGPYATEEQCGEDC